MSKPKNSSGFSVIGVIAIILVITAMSFGGWYIWIKHNNRDANKPASSGLNGKKDSTAGSTAKEDPYKGWKTYHNDTYGVGFKYPAEWRIEEVKGEESSNPASLYSIKYAIYTKRQVTEKYDNAISIEILDKGFDHVVSAYDKGFAQSGASQATKTTEDFKGKKSVQYMFTDTNNGQRLYLFAVGDQVYSFSSINEDLNVNRDSNYWQKFDKVLESLTVK